MRKLAEANLLRRAGRRRRGNMYEQRYVASAKRYVLSPEVLGALGADPGAIQDKASAAHLLSLGALVARFPHLRLATERVAWGSSPIGVGVGSLPLELGGP